jgi:hypothetical protein
MSEQDLNSMPVEVVWGHPILDEGFTNIPNLILRNYTRVGLSHAEWGLMCIMFSFKHDANDIFPSQETLAKLFYADKYKSGASERAVRKLIKGMEDKNLIEVGFRYINGKRSSNYYSFEPLINTCLAFVEEKEVDPNKGVVLKRKKKKSLPEQKVPVLPEPEVPELPEQKVPLSPEPQVPTNKTREKDKNNKTREKDQNQNLSEDIYSMKIPMPLKKFFSKQVSVLVNDSFDIDIVEEFYNTNSLVKPNCSPEDINWINDFEFTKIIKKMFTDVERPVRNTHGLIKNWVLRYLSYKLEGNADNYFDEDQDDFWTREA